jgi:hypothetical protein
MHLGCSACGTFEHVAGVWPFTESGRLFVGMIQSQASKVACRLADQCVRRCLANTRV